MVIDKTPIIIEKLKQKKTKKQQKTKTTKGPAYPEI